MLYSKYSVIMGLIWFTLASAAGSWMLFAKRKYSRVVIFMIFVLGALRMLLPAEFMSSLIVNDWMLYPLLQRLWTWEPAPGVTLLQTLSGLWLIGAVISLSLLAYRYGLLFRARRNAVPVQEDDRIYAMCRKAARLTNFDGTIHLAMTQDCDTPVQAGFTELWILLPAGARDLSESGLVGVMCHEIFHFRRRDLWKKLALLIVRSILWWNPLVYLFARNVEQLMELHCDENVCRELNEWEKLDYLTALTKILRGVGKEPALTPMGYVGIQKKQYLRQRFNELLKPRAPVSRRENVIAALLCILVFCGSYFFTVQPASLPTDTELGSVMDDSNAANISFILHYPDGVYELYEGGVFAGEISRGNLEKMPYSSYPVYEVSNH